MTESERDFDHISAIFSSGLDRDVSEEYIGVSTGSADLEILRFSSKKLNEGHFCNWTMLDSKSRSWDSIEQIIVEFLTEKSVFISSLPPEFSRRLSVEAYMYDDIHFEIDFRRDLVSLMSDLKIDFGISVYFLNEKIDSVFL